MYQVSLLAAPTKIVTYIKSRVNFVCFRNVNRLIPITRGSDNGDCLNNNVPLILNSRVSIVYLHSDNDRPIMKGIRSRIFRKIDTRFYPVVLFVKTQESRRLQALYDQPFVPKPIDERWENQERIESLVSAKINNLNRLAAFTCFLKDVHLSFTGPIIRHSSYLMLSFKNSLSTVLDLVGKILAVKRPNLLYLISNRKTFDSVSLEKNLQWRMHEMSRRLGIKCRSVLRNAVRNSIIFRNGYNRSTCISNISLYIHM